MKIIVGLGNPGKKYLSTRHNIGFMVLDRLSQTKKTKFKRSFTLQALIAKVNIEDNLILLIKPSVFMNNSGRIIEVLLKKYKLIPADFLIVYDDIDLALGVLRFKIRGSSGGHRGMQSIIETLGGSNIDRIRCGIGRPQPDIDAAGYVLSDFLKPELDSVNSLIDRACFCCCDWVSQENQIVMQKHNA